jgi:signal transduction histidine kinase
VRITDFIEANVGRITERWKLHVTGRLNRNLEDCELIDELPAFLSDMALALKNSTGGWQKFEGAEHHGRHRVRAGVDIAEVAEEIWILQATILELAEENRVEFSGAEMRQLIAMVGHSTAVSVRAYSEAQEQRRADEMARHLAFIAHQIRNPLGSAALITEILTMVPEGQREGHIARLRRAISRLSKLVDDFVIDARLHSSSALDLQTIPAATLLEGACKEVASYASEREISIENDIQAMEWEVEPELMTSALINLLSTAIKFGCRGGQVRVQARASDGHLLLEIEDKCGQLPEELQERLFEPVQKREYRTGFGLGLSLVKQVVTAHHGNIDVLNRGPEGFSFVLDMPCRQRGTGGERVPS